MVFRGLQRSHSWNTLADQQLRTLGSRPPVRVMLFLLCSGALALTNLPAAAQVSALACGNLQNGFGPFDYRSSHHKQALGDTQTHAQKLFLVESAHFTLPVEMGSKGSTTALPGGDLDYTLRAFPNHHRALVTITKIWERERLPTPRGFPKPVECYFERAVRFQPSDAVTRMLYASFLIKGNRIDPAMEQLQVAALQAEDNPLTHFNVGMMYADAKRYDAALIHAHKAMALGLERQDLKHRLDAVGQWRDPAKPST
jgi:tetratricopeptide (TPR) repeat protein